MQSISEETTIDLLIFVVARTELTILSTKDVSLYHHFLNSIEGMNLFDATCMRLQTIGETIKKIDSVTEGQLLKHYTETPWRSVFGLRNVISHEYLSIIPNQYLIQ